MKKFLALLLVLVLVVGLMAACKKPAEPTEPTDPTTPTVNEKPFKGKTLQIWGMTGDFYSLENCAATTFLQMMKAAIEDWAALNEVTLEYVASYKQDALLAAMNAGEKPDFAFVGAVRMPETINMGVLRPFTAEEKAQVAAICGETFLDQVAIGKTSYGVNFPWSGYNMVYYNQTLCDEYGIKTPKEYFEEGEWTWENFVKCAQEMTMDTDGDSKIDYYGINKLQGFNLIRPRFVEDDKGNISFDSTSAEALKWFELAYEVGTTKVGLNINGTTPATYRPIQGMVLMSLQDAEPWNYQHVFSEANGYDFVCAPAPSYDGTGESVYILHTLQAMGLPRTCDEPEAAISMLCYLLQCGMKYRADLSLGAIKCDFEGPSGASAYSKKWNELYATWLDEYKAAAATTKNYDAEYMKAMWEFMEKGKHVISKKYTGLTDYDETKDPYINPPATVIAALKEKLDKECETYNSLYVY